MPIPKNVQAAILMRLADREISNRESDYRLYELQLERARRLGLPTDEHEAQLRIAQSHRDSAQEARQLLADLLRDAGFSWR